MVCLLVRGVGRGHPDQQFTLYTLVKHIRDADTDLVWVFILDAEGNVLAHTFDQGFPIDLLGINQVPPLMR